jgi:UDP-glucose 4,6-dehydratase
MRKIVITGGAGFIGSHLSEYISYKFPNCRIFILDKLTYAGKRFYLKKILKKKRIFFFKIDILESKKYKKILKNCDLAINIAAESHVDNSFDSPAKFTLNNTLGSHIFLNSCVNQKVKKIIHISSDEVYGDIRKGKFNEKSKLNPTNPYSASKAAADIIMESYKYCYKKQIIIVRSNNIFGTRQYPEKIIPKTICNLLENKKIPIHGNGKNIRYFLSVKDFCDAVFLIIKKTNRGIYNIASNRYFKNLDLVKLICKKMNKNPSTYIKFVKDRMYNDKRYSISCLKIKRLGWKPKYKIENELDAIINWYKKNKHIYK